MIDKERRTSQDRRGDSKRRKFNDPYNHLPERRNMACRRIGEERRLNAAKK